MTVTTKSDPDPGGGARWPAVSLVLAAAAWWMYFLIVQYADRLRDMWGPAPDVVDALGRDSFVGRHTLPYVTVVVALDVVAAACLFVRIRRGWPLAVKVLACAILVPSCGVHGLAWFVTWFFAA